MEWYAALKMLVDISMDSFKLYGIEEIKMAILKVSKESLKDIHIKAEVDLVDQFMSKNLVNHIHILDSCSQLEKVEVEQESIIKMASLSINLYIAQDKKLIIFVLTKCKMLNLQDFAEEVVR